MTDPQISSREILAVLRTMDARLNELTQVFQKLFQQGQELMPQSFIPGPSREKARDETSAYIKSVPDFRAKALGGGYGNRLKLVRYVMEQVQGKPDEIAVEFGVCGGESLSVISRMFPGKVYGFDSFEGLPHDEGGWSKGQFARDGMKLDYAVGPNTELVKGWFSDTLPKFVEQTDLAKISFVHVDSDLYSSAKEIFDIMLKKMPQEIIILFDEYWNFEGWKDFEHKAFQEFIAQTGRTYEYLAYMDCGQQVAVKLHAAK